MPRLSVSVLCTNERHFLDRCLGALADQTYQDREVLLVDNGSTDGSADHARQHHPWVRVIPAGRNLFYCGGQNLGIRESRGELVMPLNADVFLAPDFLEHAVAAMDEDPRIGQVQGKLYQIGPDDPVPTPGRGPDPGWVVDTVGIEVRRSRRNFDRGQEEPDIGQYDFPEDILGADGSAPLYRRCMLEEAAVEGEVFPEDFKIYREVVDLSWRTRSMGWLSRFEPRAIGFHVRGFSPRTRRSQPRRFRRFSLRNRWATLIRNETLSGLRRDGGPIFWFELLMLTHAVLREPHLLGVIPGLARDLPRLLRQRRTIRSRVRVSPAVLQEFFG